MPVPNSFANVTTSIPLSQLDANFNTPITLGNTAIQLGNTVTTLNNMTLANVTVSSGNVTITNVTVTTANVTTANIATAEIANVTVSGTGTFAAGSNTAPSITTSGDTNTGIFFPAADTVAIGTGGTEALRVNSSQSLLLNTTSAPAASAKMKIATSARTGAFFDLTATGGENWIIDSTNTTGSTDVLGIYANGATGLYIQDTGNVGIGTSSPTTVLDVLNATPKLTLRDAAGRTLVVFAPNSVDDGFIGTTSNHALPFRTNNTERARITSGGNLLVGSTTDDARLRVNGTAVVGRFVADGGGYANDVVLIDTSGTAAGTGFDLIQANAGGAGQFRVRGDGTLFAQNTTVQSISDQRVKENIRDADEGLAVVTELRPVRFDFKEGFGNDRKNQLGFIAQEIEQVFPDAVDVAAKEETDDEDAEPYKTVGAAALIPVLVKAIQEQQAMIEELKSEIAALKAQP